MGPVTPHTFQLSDRGFEDEAQTLQLRHYLLPGNFIIQINIFGTFSKICDLPDAYGTGGSLESMGRPCPHRRSAVGRHFDQLALKLQPKQMQQFKLQGMITERILIKMRKIDHAWISSPAIACGTAWMFVLFHALPRP
jgi:hypothetical protein